MTSDQSIESGGQHAAMQSTRCNVLVVDDEPINCHIMSAILSRFGCSVKSAANGELALTMASAETFDLIFMDIQMPVLDGIETTLQLRSHHHYKRNAHTPIIATTAYAVPGDEAIYKNAGITDQLPKPVTISSIQHILQLHTS